MSTASIRLALVALNFVIWGFVVYALGHPPHPKYDPLGAVQGRYSQLDCHNQPGTHPQYVNVDGHPYFLACGVADTVNDPAPVQAPNDDPHLTGWIHVLGCPRASKNDLSHADTILVFDDGRIYHGQDGNLNEMQRAKLLAYIGDTRGLNIVYECGAAN